MAGMLDGGSGENQDVVKLHDDKAVQEVPEYVREQGLEYRWGIGEAERLDQVLEASQVGVESSLQFIHLSDTNQMVRVPRVQLSENGGPVQELKV